MAILPATNKQIPDHAILDFYNKQTYLGNAYISSSNTVALATANTEYPVMLLSNPSTNSAGQPSGNPQSNLGLFQSVRKLSQATNVSTATTIFRFYAQPVAANPGSPANIANLRPASSNTSKMLSYISPTITGNVDQVQTVTAVADVSGSLNSKYFMIYSIDPIGSSKAFYVWFNINSAGVDPAVANATGVEVSAATSASASTLGGDIRTALGALTSDFTLTGSGANAIVTNVNPGPAPIAIDGAAATGFTFANTTPGVNNYGTLTATFAVNYQEIDSSLLYILDPGYKLLVTAQCDTNTTKVICELSWYEL